VNIIQQIDSLTIGVTADDHVLHLVHHAGQLKHGWLCSSAVRGDQRAVRDQVTSVPHYKHITHISLCEPGGQHPRVYARDKNSSGDRVVPHFLKLLYHVPLLVHPVLHDAM